jgi:hypothetical protein
VPFQDSSFWIGPANVELINANSNFNFYPNPTTDLLNIETQNKISNIQICNILGKQIMNFPVNSNSNSNSINIEKLQKGIYFVNLVDNNSKVETFKIVKK